MFKNNTILLVEDNVDMQEYMRLLLEDECKQLFFASNGKEGIEQYKQNKPDLIITDLNMPIMNGIIMSKEIKNHDSSQPIVLLTAHGDIQELQEAINIGLNAFISKPIENIEILFNTIDKLLKKIDKKGTCNTLKRDIKNEADVNANNVAIDILHDDQEYVDYESLISDMS